MHRLVVLCCLAVAALAPSAAGAAGLPKERYTPIGTALTAHAAFASRPSEELAELAAESCAAMRDDGAFMRAYAGLCAARLESDVAFAVLDDCKRPAACRTAVREIRAAVADVLATGRAFTALVAKEVPDVRCRRALDVDGEERRGLKALDAALKGLGVGLREGSRRRVRAAERRLARVRGIPSAEQNLGRLQRACAAGGSADAAPSSPA